MISWVHLSTWLSHPPQGPVKPCARGGVPEAGLALSAPGSLAPHGWEIWGCQHRGLVAGPQRQSWGVRWPSALTGCPWGPGGDSSSSQRGGGAGQLPGTLEELPAGKGQAEWVGKAWTRGQSRPFRQACQGLWRGGGPGARPSRPPSATPLVMGQPSWRWPCPGWVPAVPFPRGARWGRPEAARSGLWLLPHPLPWALGEPGGGPSRPADGRPGGGAAQADGPTVRTDGGPGRGPEPAPSAPGPWWGFSRPPGAELGGGPALLVFCWVPSVPGLRAGYSCLGLVWGLVAPSLWPVPGWCSRSWGDS